MRLIAAVNQSTALPAREFDLMVAASRQRMHDDVAPRHNILAPTIAAFPSLAHVPPEGEIITFVDHAAGPDPGYGEHDELRGRKPIGHVYVNVCLRNGCSLIDGVMSVSCTFDHEVIELALDPHVNLWADDDAGKIWMYEGADWVENDEGSSLLVKGSDGKTANVGLSNFLFPEAFDPKTKRGTQLDFLGSLDRPFTMTKGGYGVYRHTGQDETQNACRLIAEWGSEYPEWKRQAKIAHKSRSMRHPSIEHVVRSQAI